MSLTICICYDVFGVHRCVTCVRSIFQVNRTLQKRGLNEDDDELGTCWVSFGRQLWKLNISALPCKYNAVSILVNTFLEVNIEVSQVRSFITVYFHSDHLDFKTITSRIFCVLYLQIQHFTLQVGQVCVVYNSVHVT